MNKTEVLDEHDSTWQENGLSNLNYSELQQKQLSEHCVVYQVDVGENDHWTDLVSNELCTQLDTPVETLKARFASR
jgi:hypothetical protein